LCVGEKVATGSPRERVGELAAGLSQGYEGARGSEDRGNDPTGSTAETHQRRHRQDHLSIALGVQAARRGHRVAFATAHEWVLRLGEAKRVGRLDDELGRLGRIPLVICDEVGYIPFDPEAAALFFALVSSRYERSSLIVSSNKTFSAWTEIFGDAVAVAAMVDRLVHHAEVIVLKGDSYRFKDKGKEVIGSQTSG
jgi:hypothetical protein